MLFSPGGKPFSCGSTSIEDIIDKFLKGKLEDRQRDQAEGKSIGFEELEDLRKESQTLNEKERRRIEMYKITHPGSEIPPDKHMEEQRVAMLLRVKKILNETKSAILDEHFKFDLNVVPEPEEDESS
uniref:Mads box protein n=1 Tax=Solanum tuberosum TaxID=4113 RepID=M1DG96_SOLTU